VLVALLDKYRIAGIEEVANPEVFRLSPFREMGQISGVIDHFGTIENLKTAVNELQKKLYREDTI
jgi:type I restriction enzyme R subunit